MIPETIFFTGAAIKWAARNGWDLLFKSQKYYDKLRKAKNLPTQSIKRISDEEGGDILNKLVADEFDGKHMGSWFATRWFKGQQRRGFTERAGGILSKQRHPLKTADIDSQILEARKALKGLKPWSKADRKIIKAQNIKIRDLLKERTLATPHLYRSILGTELGSQVVGAMWEQIIGTGSAWIGYMAGGVSSGIVLAALERGSSGLVNLMSKKIIDTGESLVDLTKEQTEILIKTGKLPKTKGVSEEKIEALQDFSFFLKSLPYEERKIAFSQLKHFQQLRQDLINQGMDPKVLSTTFARGMNLIVFMAVQEKSSNIILNTSKKVSAWTEDIARAIKSEADIKEQYAAFTKEYDTLTKQADELGYSGNDKYKLFRNELEKLHSNLKINLELNQAEINSVISDVLHMTKSGLFDATKRDSESLKNLIEQIIRHDILTRKPRDDSEAVVSSMGDNLEKAVQQVLDGVDKKYISRNDFFEKIGKLNDPNLEIRHADLAKALVYELVSVETVKTTVGSAKFKYLNNLTRPDPNRPGQRKKIEIDVTEWTRNLFKTKDADINTEYDIIVDQEKLSSILRKLSKITLSNENTIGAFANVSGRESIEQLLDPKINPNALELEDYLLKEINGTEEFLDNFFQGEEITKVNYRTLKSFIQFLHGGDNLANGKGLSDFDIFRWVDDYLNIVNDIRINADVPLPAFTLPRIKLNLEDIQRLSSGFSDAARNAKSGSTQQRKYNELGRTIVETIEGTEGGEELYKNLLDAKSYWLNEVVNRFRNPNFNALGNKLHDTSALLPRTGKKVKEKEGTRRHRNFNEAPEKWINLRPLFKEGVKGADEANKLIDQLEKTFGRYVETEDGKSTYILDGKKAIKVKNMLNSLLEKELGFEPGLKKVKESVFNKQAIKKAEEGKLSLKEMLEIEPKFTLEKLKDKDNLKDAGKLFIEYHKQHMLFKQKDLDKTIAAINSEALKKLEDKGLLNLKKITDYNLDIGNYFLNKGELDTAIGRQTEKARELGRDINKQINVRANNLERVFKAEGIPNFHKLDEPRAFDFFTDEAYGRDRIENVVQGLIKLKQEGKGGYSEEAAKKILADYVMSGLAKKARVGRLQKDAAPEVSFDKLDADILYENITRNEKILRELAGKETYEGALRLAQFMRIVNRESSEKLSPLGITVRIPRGLSLESYVSRAYSIYRGIISTRYVATEVALLALRKRRASLLQEILSDSEAIDAIIMLIERGGDVPARIHAKIQTVILTALAKSQQEDKDEKMEHQLYDLNLIGN